MIKLVENLPIAEIKSIMADPDIWPTISEDGQDVEEFEPQTGDLFQYLGIYANGDLAGMFLVHADGLTCVKVHMSLFKPFRLLYALQAVESLIGWFTTLPKRIQKLNADIPEYNDGAIRLATESGFTLEGANRQSIMKDGKLYDQLRFGMTRKEAVELCLAR